MSLASGAVAPARQTSIRQHNLALALAHALKGAPLTRAELARRSGLTKATVSSLVDTLVQAGILAELPEATTPLRSGLGRRGQLLELAPACPVALGLEVGVAHLAGVVVDLGGRVVAARRVNEDNRSRSPNGVVAALAELAGELLAGEASARRRVLGAGVAVPGVVTATGVVGFAPNLVRLEQVAITSLLEAELASLTNLVRVDNEANLAALAEHWWRPGAVLEDFLLVSGGIGVGAGIVLPGQLFGGASGSAGELGHVCVATEGPGCGCGARGCLERYAGEEALARAAGLWEPSGAHARHPWAGGGLAEALLQRAARRDPAARAALRRAGWAIGVALSSVLNVLDVPVVVLAGSYATLAGELVPVIGAELAHRVVRHRFARTTLVVSSLGEEAATRGAAALVLEELRRDLATVLPELAAPASAAGPHAALARGRR